jgi:hypothetical protein
MTHLARNGGAFWTFHLLNYMAFLAMQGFFRSLGILCMSFHSAFRWAIIFIPNMIQYTGAFCGPFTPCRIVSSIFCRVPHPSVADEAVAFLDLLHQSDGISVGRDNRERVHAHLPHLRRQFCHPTERTGHLEIPVRLILLSQHISSRCFTATCSDPIKPARCSVHHQEAMSSAAAATSMSGTVCKSTSSGRRTLWWWPQCLFSSS